jgi:hypothetical protein
VGGFAASAIPQRDNAVCTTLIPSPWNTGYDQIGGAPHGFGPVSCATHSKADLMIIDFHTHVLAPEDQGQFTGAAFHADVGAYRNRAVPNTIENVLEAAEIGGVDISVISNPLHNMRDMDREQQLATIKRHNRFIAAQQEKYDSIYGFAAAVPYGDDRFHREFERAVREDGLKGAWITSSLQGQYPDDDELCRSSNSPPSSTCPWSFTHRRSGSVRSECETTGSRRASAARWTARWRSRAASCAACSRNFRR